ncbi:hypothetical protein MUP79_07050 [Candidatus Bathyarchaeota archaeon]|nr:hypothetical protein [Candidatus Bathyarchaeota archaeon]
MSVTLTQMGRTGDIEKGFSTLADYLESGCPSMPKVAETFRPLMYLYTYLDGRSVRDPERRTLRERAG